MDVLFICRASDTSSTRKRRAGLKKVWSKGRRARHYVRAFFRRVEKPAPVQLEIARAERTTVPEGHTFVRAAIIGAVERPKGSIAVGLRSNSYTKPLTDHRSNRNRTIGSSSSE
jgi:hypothetical protein